MHSTEGLEEVFRLLSDICTGLLFIGTCGLLALLVPSYIVVQFCRDAWINFLEKRFPNLEFVRSESLRCAADTARNVGIISVLVAVRGRCDIGFIQNKLLEDVVDKRLEDGRLAFRHLRKILTTRWGKYAWCNGAFRIENHIAVGWSVFRGRPVSEVNIQECVCEVVSKYLPSDIPPWHFTIIPCSADRYYLLLRIHHLLLSDETGIRICDMLPVVSKVEDMIQWRKSTRPHPFLDLYKPPKALPALIDQLSENFSNRWNEFLAVYDPIQNPTILKTPGIRIALALILIASIATLKSKSVSLREFRIRSVRWKLIKASFWSFVGPVAFSIRILKYSWAGLKTVFFRLPLLLACEFWALRKLNDEQYSDRSMVKNIIDSWSTLHAAFRELVYLFRLFYGGPRIFIEDIFASCSTGNFLQSLSHSGRKVVSWSEPVSLLELRAIEEVTGASTCDIVLTATAASFRDFFQTQGRIPPSILQSTACAVTQDQVLGKTGSKAGDRSCGFVCLPIPTRNPWEGEDDGPVTELHGMQQSLLRTRLRQPAMYLTTSLETDYGLLCKSLPFQVVRFGLNALSRRFPVFIQEVLPSPSGSQNLRLWDQDVDTLLYWNPPQANVCISITLMCYNNNFRIGVMADSQLSPHHSIISSKFPGHIRRLAAAAGAPVELRMHRFPSDASDESGGIQTPGSLSSSSLDVYDD